MSIPTEQEVLEYFKSLSNWGRWGDDDQLGTPNLITPEKTKKAIANMCVFALPEHLFLDDLLAIVA